MNELKFKTLREANLKRLPQFRDRQGSIAHTHPTGADWSPDRWMNAVTGEVGECAGELKKAARGDYGPTAKCAMNGYPEWMPDEVRQKIAKEMADVVVYLDILAVQFGIDLGNAVMSKFNEVSNRVSSTVSIFELSTGEVVVSDDSEIPF
jgi:NTP pyrophosphatase (non-canonical NTP hydrolase)